MFRLGDVSSVVDLETLILGVAFCQIQAVGSEMTALLFSGPVVNSQRFTQRAIDCLLEMQSAQNFPMGNVVDDRGPSKTDAVIRICMSTENTSVYSELQYLNG